jgi:hypothetical protein
MSMDIKELRVGREESTKRIMYLAKEFLLNNESVDVVAGTSAAETASRSCEALARLNYVTYSDIRTETNIVNGRRRTRLVIRIKKTSQFAKLYQENEANKKQKETLREEQNKTPTEKK